MKEQILPSYEIENQFSLEGFKCIAGTDEAGRGPLCGDVVAAAVILPRGLVIDGLNDSKKLSEKKREALFEIICKEAITYGIASATPKEIDELNILNASQLAMRRAVAQCNPTPDLVLVDGNIAREFEMKAVPVIKGDARSLSIAAASVLAKVTRDRMCIEWDRQYPDYSILKHKGYPTKEHIAAVQKYGPTEIYRKSFLKKIL